MSSYTIQLTDKAKWKELVDRSISYDFHHCHSYHELEHSGTPFLFVVANEADDFIAFPLVKRPIPGTQYYDCTSVYGYAGPISSKPPESLPPQLLIDFQEELKVFVSKEKIVAAFTRMHPIIEQDSFLDPLGKVIQLNKTVAIDLSLPVDLQRQQYRKAFKYRLNVLRRSGYTVKKADTASEIKAFVDIYTQTMDRVNAQESYYFDEDYFRNFLNSEDFTSFLLLAYKDGEVAAGAIFTATRNIMQYHLAGTSETYILDAPMKLVIDEARLIGSEMGLQYLHLGGGVGGSDDDSLFLFKAGFSDLNFTYRVWQLVANQPVYEELVAQKQKEKTLNPNYFPLYRG
ncbi:GNAT family N-acetyltransferase [Taibaiella soli]|uniref:GNAT family N-acetyltransferase n=1 Tax=Taibaiella soli TaxID=1649169 RepID=A0A2W2BDS9_9BACT|nr:GNAT family N-acetyltransferase [Taibaiella soli]PZF74037.1 GNAT family N-acetyltransferase [Taibaiella soli]